jgi:hypothetical protein
MIGRILAMAASLLLLAVCAAIAMGVVSIVGSEIAPAVAAGSLSVATDTMILNHVWRGNEVYVILGIYVVLVPVLAFFAFRMARKAFLGSR